MIRPRRLITAAALALAGCASAPPVTDRPKPRPTPANGIPYIQCSADRTACSSTMEVQP